MAYTHGKIWTQAEVDQLRTFKREGKTYAEISGLMGIPITTIEKAGQRYHACIRPSKENPAPVLATSTEVPSASRTINLAAIEEKYDVRQAILRELGLIPRRELMPQEELCKVASGGDRGRFNRCVEINAAEFQALRIKLKLGDAPEGKWFWGSQEDIAAARKKVEEYA